MYFKEYITYATTGVFTYQIHPPLHLLLTQPPFSFTHLQKQARKLLRMKRTWMGFLYEQPVYLKKDCQGGITKRKFPLLCFRERPQFWVPRETEKPEISKKLRICLCIDFSRLSIYILSIWIAIMVRWVVCDWSGGGNVHESIFQGGQNRVYC